MTADVYVPFTNPAAMREALERITTMHRDDGHGDCRECEVMWPCMTYRVAEQALT